MNWTASPMWKGGSCFIIGGGPSMPRQFGVPEDVVAKVRRRELSPEAYSPYLAQIHGAHAIGVNNSYQIGTWIDCIFFGDWPWYLVHREGLARFPNLKVGCIKNADHGAMATREGVKVLKRSGGRGIAGSPSRLFGIATDPSTVAWNHNSGAAAISLAVHFGVKRIILLGFDMHLEGNSSHWHDGHGKNLPMVKHHRNFARHLRGFPVIADDAQKIGVEILNASPSSAIDVFPKTTIKELL